MRCAIYTRKSADERADARLGTIENQRDYCEKYIASQAGDGWISLPSHYDDPGYSGGTTRRPALKRLLHDIEAGQIDIVVVYKIDRLSRSLRDFVNLVELFERHRVTFVAVTQSFSTTSSMGRLTLNVLLSFAQFERELTSERLKDWFAGARARGLWMSRPPNGYDVEDGRLAVNATQANAVQMAFRRYAVLGSALAVARELNAAGHLNRDGRPFIGRTVLNLLHNRLYRGELVYQGRAIPGNHDPIVTELEWRRAHAVMAQSPRRRKGVRTTPVGLLTGLIYGHGGRKLIHLPQWRRGTFYRYYVPGTIRYGVVEDPFDRYRAAPLESAVMRRLADLTGSAFATDHHVAAGQIRRLVQRIDVDRSRLSLTTHLGGVVRLEHDAEIAVKLKRAP